MTALAYVALGVLLPGFAWSTSLRADVSAVEDLWGGKLRSRSPTCCLFRVFASVRFLFQ